MTVLPMACSAAPFRLRHCSPPSQRASVRLPRSAGTRARTLVSATRCEFKLVPAGGGDAITVAEDSVVGRGKGAAINLDSLSVSQEHARLGVKGKQRYFCTDLESENGTFFNGTRLRPGVQYLLAPGATLAFGDPELEYTVEYEEASGEGDPMAKMLLQGMMLGASDDIKSAIDDAI